MAGRVQIKSTGIRTPCQAFSHFVTLGSLIYWISILVSVDTIGWLRNRGLWVIVMESNAPQTVIFHFSPAHAHTAIADFLELRQRPDAAMSRHRRRAAARAAWSVVQRQEGETWVGFWQACCAARV